MDLVDMLITDDLATSKFDISEILQFTNFTVFNFTVY